MPWATSRPRQLYVLPAVHLHLWTFQRNAQARRFYEARGFALVKETDGAANEEKEPDALYLWKR